MAVDVQTDDNGQVEIPISSNGNYMILARKDGYLESEDSKEVDCSMDNNCICDTRVLLKLDQPRCNPEGPNPVVLPVVVKDNITNTFIQGALVTLILTNSLSGTSLLPVEGPKYTDINGVVEFTIEVERIRVS